MVVRLREDSAPTLSAFMLAVAKESANMERWITLHHSKQMQTARLKP